MTKKKVYITLIILFLLLVIPLSVKKVYYDFNENQSIPVEEDLSDTVNENDLIPFK
jgi:hypothetical protein